MEKMGSLYRFEKIEKVGKWKYNIYSTFVKDKSDFDGNFENSPNTWVVEVEKGVIMKQGFKGELTIKESKLKHLIGTIKHKFTTTAMLTETLEQLKNTKASDLIIEGIHRLDDEKDCRADLRIRFKVDEKQKNFISLYLDYKWYMSNEEEIIIRAYSYGSQLIIKRETLPKYDEIIDYILYKSTSRIKLLQMGVKPRSFA